jgi:hypothetical protein
MHFVLYIASPCAGVPEPVGSPAPSGPILTSAAWICAAVAGTPRAGPLGGAFRAGAERTAFAEVPGAEGAVCWALIVATQTMLAIRDEAAAAFRRGDQRARELRVDIPYLSGRAHAPTRDRVVVIAMGMSALRDERPALDL